MRNLECLAEKQQQRVGYYESRANYTTLAYLAWLRFFYFAVSSNSSSALHCLHWPMATNQDGEVGASTDGVKFNVRFHQVRALHNDSFTGGEIKVYTCAIAFALLAVTAFQL
ncbi:hypothetical protein SDJN03_03072, partial [Cucurbita argyrosperma subsp. sororia]